MDEWIAYSSIEPFTESWLQTGILASTIQNMIMIVLASLGGRKLHSGELAKPTDYLPMQMDTEEQQIGMTPEEAQAYLEKKME